MAQEKGGRLLVLPALVASGGPTLRVVQGENPAGDTRQRPSVLL